MKWLRESAKSTNREYVRAVILWLKINNWIGLYENNIYVDPVANGYSIKVATEEGDRIGDVPKAIKELQAAGFTEVRALHYGRLFAPAKPYPGIAELERQWAEAEAADDKDIQESFDKKRHPSGLKFKIKTPSGHVKGIVEAPTFGKLPNALVENGMVPSSYSPSSLKIKGRSIYLDNKLLFTFDVWEK